jgi:glutamate dehydrogenase/leucine dehydrogenase
MSNNSLYQHTLQSYRRVAEKAQLPPDFIERLARPKERIELTLHPLLTDGRTHQYEAYIVHHNRSLGPAKGGIRMSNTVTLDDVSALAMEMTWKTSLIGVPFGGGKSGIAADPRSLSAQDKEILIRSFTRSAIRHMGPELYVPAPDMGTNERDMGHIRDCISYSAGISVTRGCYVTGKPVLLGGIPGRREATGKGVAVTVRLAAQLLDMDLARTRVAVQGFGNVGSVAANELHRMGAKVVAVEDIQGVTYNPLGLDIPGLNEHVSAGGEVPSFPGGTPIASGEFFSLDCEILIPAASANQITIENVESIKARLIAEGANGPTTPEADTILQRKGVFVIPDILCNAGGVFVSYLEYTQETQREQMTLEEVESRLAKRMESRFQVVHENASSSQVDMRTSALELSVKRVAEAIICHGRLP